MNTRQFPGLLKQATSKIVWIRLNRILAWALICSPLVQWVFHTPFWQCVWTDLPLLLAHAALSLALFGKPGIESRKFIVMMHVLGFSAWGMSKRDEFLMTGYHIFLVLMGAGVVVPLIVFLAHQIGVPLLMGFGILWVLMLYTVPASLMVMFVLLHVHAAAQLAGRRWGISPLGLAAGVLVFYVVTLAMNASR